ncbi:hypothetical protein [Ktedonospora formicarum]|uniref:Cell division protein FtsL n=1 Tax=Ktedonospora formicarum TaxID=2778364 RepID=A0A8J3HUY7_9CHLR|nr:hypothetical protein [Ktedonospora formicarum]GHO43731.1 hypothetical protein KSX_18940 [Ktedonospora formicarum]
MDSKQDQRDETRKHEEEPIIVASRRGQFRPFFFRMGPTSLFVASVVLISLMAVLYLSQLGQGVATNQQLQSTRVNESKIERQNHDLLQKLAEERSPAYIAEQARKQGLQPSDPDDIQIITVRGLESVPGEP